MPTTQTKTRYTLIDCLRGLSVICMVAYHLMWDLAYIHNLSMPWFYSTAMTVFQRSIRWSFILLSGFCFPLGRRPWKRGMILLGCSAVITLVSLVAIPDSPIHFGVLTLLGVAMLITIPIHKLTRKWNSWLRLGISLGLFMLTCRLTEGYVLGYTVPRWLYANYATALVGFPFGGFYSSDYVPLLPWIFAYWMGCSIYGIMEKHRWLPLLCRVRCKPLEWIGRHALPIYMAHQPVVYGILWIIFYFL